ncbi:DUF2630 family protein [Pseudonocardia acidicola]|uniref:DUF2630 family protein n=1 Tax=Pseudonocardia acidicola TaxID=2724939 RepID=A0ABX1SJT6_9PSEU|nr:DUF2630 family protein [Pseudonocardia acidicola]NMI00535.1 DUF2630 family protein [Pseudonocardia acidicola]
MDDQELRDRINALVDEEHRLERAHVGKSPSEAEVARLERLGVELDRLWDLLRQRQARRRAGLDADEARERSADVVENYRQ